MFVSKLCGEGVAALTISLDSQSCGLFIHGKVAANYGEYRWQ